MLSIAGIVSLVIRSVMLTDLTASWLSLSWQPILTVVLLAIILFLGVLTYVIRAQLAKVKTGREGLVGETGVARTDVAPSGKVFVHGELWDAISEEPLRAGEQVKVVALTDMTVKVEKAGGA